MSLRYKGGVISATPPTTTGGTSGTAKGVWTLEQQMQAQAAGNWPLSPPQAVQISRSLRFNSPDSAYLNRTPASASNRKTWTWSGWVKRGALSGGAYQNIFQCNSATTNDNNYFSFRFMTADEIGVVLYSYFPLISTQVLRDLSAWYHLVLAVDTTQATASNRMRIYINGVEVTSWSTDNRSSISQNSDLAINLASQHNIGSYQGSSEYFNGYMTNIDFVDGQALTPSSFGQTNSTTGVWEPVQTVGYLTYGTNGFHVDFADNSGTTSTTLGKDTSGRGNNWTPNNFSVTAGTGNDSLVDTPTPYGTDTGVGGEVRGNYCTLNPLDSDPGYTIANGNLNLSTQVVDGLARGSIFGNSEKWYFEVTVTTGNNDNSIGVCNQLANPRSNWLGESENTIGYLGDGRVYLNNSNITNYSSYTANDVIGVAFDVSTGKIWFAKNNTWQGSGDPANGTNPTTTQTSWTLMTGAGRTYGSGAMSFNFGQRPFAYTAPSGFKALVTQNLPTPTVIQGDDYFNTILWTGSSSTASRSFTGVGFQPDFVWAKARSINYDHILFDRVRGAGSGKELVSDTTGAEGSGNTAAYGYLSAFDSDGFSSTAGTDGSLGNVYFNKTNETYVAWNWKANGAGSSNTAGSITSTVSANTTSGFSIATFTSPSSGTATFGHGLGVAPSMIIFKTRDAAANWVVYHKSIGATGALRLNLTSATSTSSNWFNDTAPTSTVATIGILFANPYDLVAYCFAEVAGFSAFGSYVGNGSTDGPFVYTGFKPAMIWTKPSSTTGPWNVLDNKRGPYNVNQPYLQQNSSNAEATVDYVDFLSNGFKIRYNAASPNANGVTVIWCAFAENPFKYALAR